MGPQFLDKEWILPGVYTEEELERDNMTPDDCSERVPRVPFGYCNKDWEKMKAMKEDGDVYIHFRSPDYTWHSLCGREGYALLSKDGKVKGCVITCLN